MHVLGNVPRRRCRPPADSPHMSASDASPGPGSHHVKPRHTAFRLTLRVGRVRDYRSSDYHSGSSRRTYGLQVMQLPFGANSANPLRAPAAVCYLVTYDIDSSPPVVCPTPQRLLS